MAAVAGEDAGPPPPVLCFGWESHRSAVEKRVTSSKQNKKNNEAKQKAATNASATTITVGASYTTDRMRAEGQSPLCSFGFQVNAIQRDEKEKPGPSRTPPTPTVSSTATPGGSVPAEEEDGSSSIGRDWREKLTLERAQATVERAQATAGPMYTNATKFWGTYLTTAGSLLRPSFAYRIGEMGQKHSNYVIKKADQAKSTLSEWIDTQNGGGGQGGGGSR